MEKTGWGSRLREKTAVRSLGGSANKQSPNGSSKAKNDDIDMEDASTAGVERESSASTGMGFRIPSGVSYVDTDGTAEEWNYGDVADDEAEWFEKKLKRHTRFTSI